MKRFALFAFSLLFALALVERLARLESHTLAYNSQQVDFARDFAPIFQQHCYSCHSATVQKGKLRLDSLAAVMQGGVSGKVITPGNGKESLLVKRLRGAEGLPRMPIGGESLSEDQIERITAWIDQMGAEKQTAKDMSEPEESAIRNPQSAIPKHWAYMKPIRPALPVIKNTAWVRNPIDRFILERLEREGLQPSPEADRVTLLRRVSYDLTGLPPTPAEVDAFLADKLPGAYERVVDRLLASPRYGERMAMQWLDLARYADTHGYHIDSHRDMWHWRDWVISAFNRNQPFDQFTIEQLAGDLLPQATREQQIASGFNRNHMINFEGGAIPEEYHVEYVVDRVETTAITWMAMTLGCARCHNHKYDPITQKEFYQFFAYFNNVAEEGLDGRTGNAKPMLRLPTPAQTADLDKLTAALKAVEEKLAAKEVFDAQAGWEKVATRENVPALRQRLVAHYELDNNFSDVSGQYRNGRTLSGDPTFGNGQIGKAVRFDGDTQVTFGNFGAFDTTDNFSIAFWMLPSTNMPLSVMQKLDDSPTRSGFDIGLEDLKLDGIQRYAARLGVRLIARLPDQLIQVRTRERFSLSEWAHATFTYDGSGKAAGVKLFINGKLVETEMLQDHLGGSIQTAAELQVGNKQTGKPYRGQLDDLRIYSRVLTAEEAQQLAIHYPAQVILSGVLGKRSKEDEARLRDYFLHYAAPAEMREQYAERNRLRKERDELNRQVDTVMTMSELEKPRETFILARGDYQNRTEKVSAGVPAVLPPLPKDAAPNRLALAQWLVSPSHPLTARVAVNRYWQMFFGQGLVKTSEDMGTRGDPPTHPELLDWLATEFIASGWNVKAMQRLIVTSATYRQSSKVTPALLERDPENRLLARGPRSRLTAEMIRDTALFVSGLLHEEIGGPSVFPYQPPGVWEELAFGDGFSAQEYKQSTGKDLYRRSLYTFWKRTAPPPELSIFDAPDREKCVARRAQTNTPLQALVLLNDPTYVEAARALAHRAIREGGKTEASRIIQAFRLVTARQPMRDELATLTNLLRRERAHYRNHQDEALTLLNVGELKSDERIETSELAAWTVVCSAILNLDETITKE